jgi:UMF1 family MFS transporter
LSKTPSILRKNVIGWSLYDFANTIYSMNILSLYFKRWVVEDLGREGIYYDIAYSASMLTMGLIMPALGEVSDHSGRKKHFLFVFTFICCLAISAITFIPPTLFFLIIVVFAISNFSYEGGMVFYNSLLYSVSDGKEARLVSGLGVALGYTGSVVGMILVLPWVTGKIAGWSLPWSIEGGKRGAFIPSAVLFLIFSIPVFVWVNEKKELIKQRRENLINAYREVWRALKSTRQYPGVLRFLVADYFLEDAVVTVILNIGIFSSLVIGFSDSDLTVFLLISTVSAMVGSFVIGKISQHFRLKLLMMLIISGWILTMLLFIIFDDPVMAYFLGSLMGVLLGGLWTVSRPLLAEMVPRNELGRFFGLYSLSGRAAAVVGPVVWGSVVYIFNASRPVGALVGEYFGFSGESAMKLPYRLAVISLAVMMAIGLFIFRKIPTRNENNFTKP